MGLVGNNNEEKIWNFLKSKIPNNYGVAGLMGNLYAESALNPQNLQNTFETKLGYTDAGYTAAVDNGSYTNFVKDSAGYGLAQWTYWTRKQNMLAYHKAAGKSIGDLETQLNFLIKELTENFGSVFSALKTATSARDASDYVLIHFEAPKDQSVSVQVKRAGYGQTYYEKFANAGGNTGTETGGNTMGYTNSSLVDCTVKSPNHSGKRTHSIDRITPHCVVGQLTAENIGSCFTSSSVQASCNYGIGKDGRVCLIVDEVNRSWCSSSNANDQRAITIECASEKAEPYTMNDAVYKKLVKLCIDICKRNGLKKVLWFADKEKSLSYTPKTGECVLTVHRWFANKSCPGNWLYGRMGQLAAEVNAGLGATIRESPAQKPAADTETAAFKVGDKVQFNGSKHYVNANASCGVTCKPGIAKVTQIYQYEKSKHPYHLVAENGGGSSVHGWVDATDVAAAVKTHTVKDGDTLWGLAAKYLGSGARYPEIKKLNGLTSDLIKDGQVLKIPN